MLQYGEAEYRVWNPETKLMRFIANSETIMRNPGLKDKKGNIIFGGDIVRVEEGGKLKAGLAVVVKYKHGWHCEYHGHPYGHFFLNTLTAPLLEVVGDIFKNPDLLGVKKAESLQRAFC